MDARGWRGSRTREALIFHGLNSNPERSLPKAKGWKVRLLLTGLLFLYSK